MAEFYDGPHATPSPANDGPIYLGIKNLSEDGHLDLSDIRHISEADYPRWVRRVEPRAGDLVFTYEASLHRYAILPDGFRGCLGRRIALIRPNPERVDTQFLMYLFLSPLWRSTVMQRVNVGSTVDRIPLIEFPRFPVAVPDLRTQRQIAALLSAYDELIENNTRRIEVLEEMAQAIYREWFVEYRYPGHEEVQLVDSDLGPIPRGWEVVSTSKLIHAGVLEIGDGYRAKNVEFGPDGVPFLRVKNLQDEFDFSDVDLLPADALARVGRKRSQPGDCVITMKGTVGRIGFVSERTPEFVYSPQLSYWRVLNPELLQRAYLRCWMLGPEFSRQCAVVKGSTDMADYVNLKDQRQMRILQPPQQIQQAFSSVVEPMFDLQSQLRAARHNLRLTRDLLLPRLISGEVDVSGFDIDVGDAAA